MWIQVRTMDGSKSLRVDGLSKISKIEELREKLVSEFDAPVERQRLFYRGKQLEDGHTLFDYSVGLNEIIQLLIRPPTLADVTAATKEDETTKNVVMPLSPDTTEDDLDIFNSTYKLGDIIDARDVEMGAWFEAKISKITRVENSSSSEPIIADEKAMDVNDNFEKDGENKENVEPLKTKELTVGKCDDYVYHTVFSEYEDETATLLPVSNIRPRACAKLPLEHLKSGDMVMVNYNYDEPDTRGYWYDAKVISTRSTRTIKELICTVYIGKDLVPMENCKILFTSEIFKIEEAGSQCNYNDPEARKSPEKRESKPECDHCGDNPKKKCKHCSCHNCGVKDNPGKTLMCDECDAAFHIYCLTPPLTAIPDVDEWFCPMCKNDETEVVRAGEKLKKSKKKSKMPSARNNSGRDWGRGMACMGTSKKCNIVSQNHFGVVPGVEVGTLWKFRVQVSESGIHRPPVAGIHGREEEGAYSIVLSGGYEDDEDNGDEFTYTGSGGRDLSGNKRTADQSCDQLLTRMNKALAKSCKATLDSKVGGDAGDKWREGKPVRVIRNCKGRKHSQYAPEEGNRYDGIYKIVKFWPESGKSGFKVWRYMLRRDDPIPAPWTDEGRERTENLGLEMQYPDGYLESQAEKEKDKKEKTPAKGKGKGKRKRSLDDEDVESETTTSAKKKRGYKLEKEVSDLIKNDSINEKLWADSLNSRVDGAQKFLAKVEETFLCICCQDIVVKPVTTECKHNICKQCLLRSFKAEVYSCSACRADIDKDFAMNVNKTLEAILNKLFPGYEAGR